MIHFAEFIIQELCDYLININDLLNTTVRFNEYKEKYFCWRLNEESSFKYYREMESYNYIDSQILLGDMSIMSVSSPVLLNLNKKQLSLDLRVNKKVKDNGLKYLGNVYKLNLIECKNITDEGIKHLGNVRILNIGVCKKITDEGIKYLGNLHTLEIHGCNITDEGIKYLGNIHTLNLCWCDKITNEGIKHLGNLHT